MKKYLSSLCSLCVLLSMAATAWAAGDVPRVMFIQSYSKSTPCHEELNRGLTDGLRAGGIDASVSVEYLGVGIGDRSVQRDVVSALCRKAREQGIDLIVTASGVAAYSLLYSGDSLVQELPLVCTDLKAIGEDVLARLPNVCGFRVQNDYEAVLREAMRVFPERKEFVCIIDTTAYARRCEAELEAYWEEFHAEHPDYSWQVYNLLSVMPTRIIRDICYAEDHASNRIVLVPNWSTFMSFVAYNSYEAPIYAFQNLAVSSGSLCAYDLDPYDIAHRAGLLSAQVLEGTSPSDIGVIDLRGKFLYNYRTVKQFHLDEAFVEEGGVLFNVTWFERYREWVIGGIVTAVLGVMALIGWLLSVYVRENRRRKAMQTKLMVQEQLVKQRNEFNQIFCSFRDGLVTYGTDLGLHFINPAMLRMLGLSFDESYAGRKAGSYLRILHEGEDILYRLIEQAMREKTPVAIPEKSFVQEIQAGLYFPVSGEVIPMLDGTSLSGLAILCHNISDEERQRLLLHMTMESSNVYYWQFDLDNQVFHFPPRLLHTLGYDPHDGSLTREQLRLLAHPDDLSEVSSRFESVMTGRAKDARALVRLRHADGTYEWWEFWSTTYDGIEGSSPYMVLGICQSIQRYKDAEAQLIEARDRALQADRLKSAFLANMTHEIRTPLNSIVGFSALLDEVEQYRPEEVKEFVRVIQTNSKLLLTLVSDVLDISHIESGDVDFHFGPCNLPGLLREIYEQQSREMPEGVELRLDLSVGDDLLIETDAIRLQQVVVKLLSNARKFTLQGHAVLGCREEGPDTVVIYVEDTGKGIPPASLPRIFERFYKVDEYIQGAGLGLSIVQTLVDRLHGTISVQSEVGKGSRFEVRLPQHPSAGPNESR